MSATQYEAVLGVIGGSIDIGSTVPTEPRSESVAYDPEEYAGQFFSTRDEAVAWITQT